MFALLLLGLIASASTAPRYDPYEYNNGYQPSMDTFWDNFNREMVDLQSQMENVMKNNNNQEGTKIEGNEYKININMSGFNKEDIVVEPNKGIVVIQAKHNVPGEPNHDSLYIRELPDFVNENGSWSYNNDVLTIVFPIIQHGNDNAVESNLPNNVNSVNEKPNGNYYQAVTNGGVQ